MAYVSICVPACNFWTPINSPPTARRQAIMVLPAQGPRSQGIGLATTLSFHVVIQSQERYRGRTCQKRTYCWSSSSRYGNSVTPARKTFLRHTHSCVCMKSARSTVQDCSPSRSQRLKSEQRTRLITANHQRQAFHRPAQTDI